MPPPSTETQGALTVRRGTDGTEVLVGDRLTVRLDKARYRGAWLDVWDHRFVLDIDTGLNAQGGITHQLRAPAIALPRPIRRRRRAGAWD